MKQKIIKIAQDLKKGIITTETARTLLLGLFGVSGRAFDERMSEEFDISKCPKCGGTDIIMLRVYKCTDCGHQWA
jgi:hypothetical protein